MDTVKIFHDQPVRKKAQVEEARQKIADALSWLDVNELIEMYIDAMTDQEILDYVKENEL